MRNFRLPLLVSVLLVSLVLLPAAKSWSYREVHDFNLLTGKGLADPYTLSFPITITAPGEVRVNVKYEGDNKHSGAVSISSPGLRRPIETEPISSKKTSFHLRHNVDSLELAKLKGKYVVYLSNISTMHREAGQIAITYPVVGEEQAGAQPIYPDLAIEKVDLNNENLVVVTVANKGPGRLPEVFYRENGPELFLMVDGRAWGGASLANFDPEQQLKKVDGSVSYVSNLKVSGTSKIRAELRLGKLFRDNDPSNNARNAELAAQAHQMRPKPLATPMHVVTTMPDLVINRVFLDKECQVVVEVANKGTSGLSEAAYEKKTSPTLLIFRDGKSWGGAALWVFDVQKDLMKPGRSVFYTSNLKVGGETNIRVEIDKENVVKELEADNNAVNTTLSCGN